MSDRIYNETLRYGFSTPIVYETYRSADYGAAFLLPIGYVIGVVPCAPQFDTASRYSPGEMWPCPLRHSNSYPSYLFQCDAQSLRPVAPR
jgi:hypothetical protein